MPGLLVTPEMKFKTLKIKKLHPTFAAEIGGVEFDKPIPNDVFQEILAASAKVLADRRASIPVFIQLPPTLLLFRQYGVIVFRKTGLDDTGHVEFSRRFGRLDDMRPYMTDGSEPQYGYYELFDAGNIDPNTGSVLQPDSPRAQYNKGNALFHIDSSFNNPRRVSYSILKAHELPPAGTGGNTGFADTRTAFEELNPQLKTELLEHDYIGAHSLYSSRKKAAPEYFKDVDVKKLSMHKHRIVQNHEPSGRMTLYIAAHMDHIENLPPQKSRELIEKLVTHATQESTFCVMHRVEGGSFEGQYRRDLRRTAVHDDSSEA
ncbi:hypothetical protein A1O1_05807 [Capronia coronata CBS 617.96]|uniref:TauD/TfdA-like domain-containing protein n=1 Tax=Capronia coronata CBS 617.96 TaxID=1182541 RepID=W9XZ03_9EURO|nr:uncharacterized protein A1O1_05807 [Capronia coronata CBS 617.96]EXJ85443.1 hypothetical protein A1O1_05807 [Capronia coronata CBS 617.96]